MMIRMITYASFVVLVIALVVAVLPGCGSGGDSESNSEVEEVVETENRLEALPPEGGNP